jgi:hypothetical protein
MWRYADDASPTTDEEWLMRRGVFVNYRVGDEEATAAFLARELIARFGADQVFRASVSIRPGDPFNERILDSVRQCAVLLAVIGPRWLDATDGSGRRRLELDGDWVRREITEALAHDVRIIPVLVGAVTLPRPDQLPPDLAPLAERQYLRLHYRSLDSDVARLLDELTTIVPELGPAAAAEPASAPEPGPGPADTAGARRTTIDVAQRADTVAGEVTGVDAGRIHGDVDIRVDQVVGQVDTTMTGVRATDIGGG